MRNRVLRNLALALAVAFVALTWVGGAVAAVVTTCGTLSASQTYNVTQNLTSAAGSCLIVAANGITINLQGHTITGSGTGAGISDEDTPRDATVVKNGTITGFVDGIHLRVSTRSTVRDVQANNNTQAGINVGDFSLVKNSGAAGNGLVGILVGSRSQVDTSNATGNGNDGILAFNFCLVTNNTANNNDQGIATGGFCTVTYNTANFNSDDGIDVGADTFFDGSKSLVSGNTANGNGDSGIEVACPSDVTNNNATGNGTNYLLFNVPPSTKPCFQKNNN